MKNNIDWVSVGKRIVSLRTINNMSREDLASKIGSSVSTVFRIESGLPPTSQYLILIASAFKVSVEYLTGLSDNPRSGIKNEAELIEVKQKKEKMEVLIHQLLSMVFYCLTTKKKNF